MSTERKYYSLVEIKMRWPWGSTLALPYAHFHSRARRRRASIRARAAPRDAVEPGAQDVAIADRAGLLDQDEERRLDGVLPLVGSDSVRRRTPSTIGPWRRRIASKAASSPRARYRSKSWDSLSPVAVPSVKR